MFKANYASFVGYSVKQHDIVENLVADLALY